MTNEPSNLDLSEPEEKVGFPWLIIAGIILVSVVIGAWLMRSKAHQDVAINALEQQRLAQKVVLDQERDKVFEITKQLDTLRGQIAAQKAGDPKEAVARYNAMAEEQRTQRIKVKALADDYNKTVAQIHELQ